MGTRNRCLLLLLLCAAAIYTQPAQIGACSGNMTYCGIDSDCCSGWCIYGVSYCSCSDVLGACNGTDSDCCNGGQCIGNYCFTGGGGGGGENCSNPGDLCGGVPYVSCCYTECIDNVCAGSATACGGRACFGQCDGPGICYTGGDEQCCAENSMCVGFDPWHPNIAGHCY